VEYQEYYIAGEAQKPGTNYNEPGMALHKAVSVAGGFTRQALRTSIILIADKDHKRLPQDIELNTKINPGDILTIGERFC
jgi:polysaccharide biosynthesis/export protein VpsN